ncbi:MAG: hypothetical protein ACFB0G_13435, partial [Leptolyngbyaceae cyanobacterium]
SIIKGVERFSEGLSALRTFEALIAFAGLIVLVSFRVVTVGTLHDASPDLSNPDDESHVCLVHNRSLKRRPQALTQISLENLATFQRLATVLDDLFALAIDTVHLA